MNPTNPDSYIFGPVPSRRLGMSLGIDLIPAKTCTFDCLYCQVGRTSLKTVETKPFVPVDEVIEQIKKRLMQGTPDTVTLAGSGEPTLHSQLDRVIASIKEMTTTKVALLTNGSLFWREEIRRRASDADIILPTLSTAFEHTFRKIHRPHPELTLQAVIQGLQMLRQDYRGQLFLEVVLLAGINDTEEEVKGLKTVIEQVSPEKIQLNTVVRPPSDFKAVALDRKRLEEIKVFLGEKAEIVAKIPLLGKSRMQEDSLISGFLDMLKRRPLGCADIAKALHLSTEEVEGLVKGLLSKGCIRTQKHLGDTYYLSNEDV